MAKAMFMLMFVIGVSEIYGAQAASGKIKADVKIRGADAQFVYLSDLPDRPLADVWDTYTILSRAIDSLEATARRTYSAVSVAKIPMSRAHINLCTHFLTEVYPNALDKALARQKEYEIFADFLKERATDLILLANDVKKFGDLLAKAGAEKHQVCNDLAEFKEALLFISRCLSGLLLKQFPEVAELPGLASVIENKRQNRVTQKARDQWKLAGALHTMITGMRNAMVDNVRVLGEELMLSIHETQILAEWHDGVDKIADGVSNLVVDAAAAYSKQKPLLKPSDGGMQEPVDQKVSCFGFISRPKKKKVKINESKNTVRKPCPCRKKKKSVRRLRAN